MRKGSVMDLLAKMKKHRLMGFNHHQCEVCSAKPTNELEYYSLRGTHGTIDYSKDFEVLVQEIDWHILLCKDCHSLGFNL